jgi:RNA polymerase sigma-70 factor (ECF subfamily)
MSPQPIRHDDPSADARAARDVELARCLAAARQGDAQAFERFYDASFAAARALARRLLQRLEPAAVDDLLADAYFEAWRQTARFDPARGSAMTWLLTLVRSRCLDLLRSRAAQPSVGGTAGGGDDDGAAHGGEAGAAQVAQAAQAARIASVAHVADLDAVAADPAERLWRQQAGSRLHAALARLSPAERWVLGLAYLREMSQTEIAAVTGLPLGTVKSHAQRAQARLRQWLTDPTA